MPQMMPMLWLFIFIFSLMIMIILTTMINFFNLYYFKHSINNKLTLNKWNWKW